MSLPGFTQVSGTRVLDATGQLLSSGTICFTPVLDDGTVTPFQAGGTLYGQVLGISVFAAVVNGAFSVQLADTSLTNPVNVAYLVSIADDLSGNVLLGGPGYRIQPAGASFNFDTFDPTLTPQLGYILARGVKGDTGSPGTFGSNVKTATQLGCVADGVTDCAPIINSYFANASASSPKILFLDGIFAVSGITLSVHGHCTIKGMSKFDTGFRLLPNSYRDCIRNGDYSLADPTNQGVTGSTPPPTSNCTSIVLQDFSIDCSGNAVLTPANQPVSGAAAHAIFGVNFQTAQDCLIENLVFTNPPAYCIMLSNTLRVRVRGSSFASGGYTQDGVHMNGPAAYIDIDNCDFATGDDAVALNAPEGYGGLIDTVCVTNCRFQDSYSAARIYTSNNPNTSYKVRQVLFANLIGVVQTVPFNIGLEPYLGSQDNTPLEQVEDVRIANCDLFPVMASDQSTKKATLVNIMTNVGSLAVNGYTQRASGSGGGFNLDPPFLIRAGAQIADLAIRDFVLYQDAHGNGTPSCVVNNLGTIGKLTFDGVRIVSGDNTAYTPLNCLIGNAGPIGTLMLESVDSTSIGLTISNGDFSQVTSVGGAAVAALPNEVPDAKMLPGWLYRSADVHALSFKSGSTPLRLTTTT